MGTFLIAQNQDRIDKKIIEKQRQVLSQDLQDIRKVHDNVTAILSPTFPD